jgi:hypothetical protein
MIECVLLLYGVLVFCRLLFETEEEGEDCEN